MKTVPFGIAALALLASVCLGFLSRCARRMMASRSPSFRAPYPRRLIMATTPSSSPPNAAPTSNSRAAGGGVFGQGGGWSHSYQWSCSATENSRSAPDSYTVHYPDGRWVTFDANPGTPYLAPPGVDRSIRLSFRRRLRLPQSDRRWQGSVLSHPCFGIASRPSVSYRNLEVSLERDCIRLGCAIIVLWYL